MRIHVYAAVNAELGLVALQYTTSTSHLEDGWPREHFKNHLNIDWKDQGYMVGGGGAGGP